MAFTPDGTAVWLALYNLGEVVKMTLATGAFGTAFTVTGAANEPGGLGRGGLVMSPDGAFLYACNGQAGTVSKIDTSSGSVVATATGVGTATNGPFVGAISPDGTTFYALTATSPHIYRIRTSDMSVQASAAISHGAYAAAMFPDGNSLLYTVNATGSGDEVQQINTPALTQNTYWNNPNVTVGGSSESVAIDVAINPNGAIYIPDFTNKGINLYPGGKVGFSSLAPWWPRELRLRASPCSA
jgi:DNA-binding beta-propeller fold protein YncE